MRPTGLLAHGIRKINELKHFCDDVDTDELLNAGEMEIREAHAPLVQLTAILASLPVAISHRRMATSQ